MPFDPGATTIKRKDLLNDFFQELSQSGSDALRAKTHALLLSMGMRTCIKLSVVKELWVKESRTDDRGKIRTTQMTEEEKRLDEMNGHREYVVKAERTAFATGGPSVCANKKRALQSPQGVARPSRA
jgi:hypothetical protein